LFANFRRGSLPGMAGGALSWTMYLLSPLGLILLWHLLEGLVRAASAMTAGEPLGTSVLWAVAETAALLRAGHQRARSQPRPPDRVRRAPDGALVQVTSATRLPWDHMTTIRCEGSLYMVSNETRAPRDSHSYVYDL